MFGANRAPILCQDCHFLPTEWNKIVHDPRDLGVPSCASKTISEPKVWSAQTVLVPCVKISTIFKWTETSFHMSLAILQFHRVHPKQFLSVWYVRRTDAPTLTVSKWTEMRFEFHPVRPKQFLSLWYVRHKPRTYLASRLSPNGPKWVSTWASSPRSTIGCNQNNFWAYGTLAQIVQLSCTYNNTISKWTEMRFYIIHVT
jgi:hypothetical protein